jgi:hypothetical protein
MFSAVKRKIGESVRSKRPDLTLKQEVDMFVQYSIIKNVSLKVNNSIQFVPEKV